LIQQRSAGTLAVRLVPAALIVVWLGLAPAVAADSVGVRFVAQLNAAIGKGFALSSDPQGIARAICNAIAATSLDLAVMMKTASAGATEHMDQTQREMFGAALQRRLVHDCVAYAPEYLGGAVALTGMRQLRSGETLVGTRSTGPNQTKILMWQVRPAEQSKYLATDVLIDGRSAMLGLRDQSALSLESNPGDIAALIAKVEH
jgi:hypothetical protein